jgi:alkanesulfonate monooxygenase SsuD/methylene tetrahydromethanopterin reductase-like flavin-dependent oxidoreductase (luciferase family)
VVRVDIYILPNRPWQILLERVRRAEEMGFGCAWIPDHFVNGRRLEEDWFEAWTLLGALAAATDQIRIGTLVSSLTLRNPSLLARAATTLDHISEGRLELGIGAAGSTTDHAMTGIPAPTVSGRAERLEEAVAIVRDLLTDGSAEGAGPHYPIEGAELRPRPVQDPRPPITVGALSRRSMRLAARLADAWNSQPMPAGGRFGETLAGEGETSLLRERTEFIDRTCEEIGRDPDTLRRSYLLLGTYRRGPGGPGSFLRRAGELRDAGARELILYWPEEPLGEGDLERVAAEALPQLV